MNDEKYALFFLATDSNKEKKNLAQLFNWRILFQNYVLARDHVEGMQQALVEMFSLNLWKLSQYFWTTCIYYRQYWI